MSETRNGWRIGAGLLALVVLGASPLAADQAGAEFSRRMAALESPGGARIGVAATTLGADRPLAYRGDERFAMCSTFKLVLAAAVLARVDEGREDLGRQVPYGADALLDYAPVARAHLADGSMSVGELCAAAVAHSDNTAANLLLESLGGPEGFTRYLRSLGDTVTRLDRTEPTLNSNVPGDPRDTTTPSAMLGTVKRLVFGTALSPGSRQQLEDWLVSSRTGTARLRASADPSWRVGNKTGTGENGATNDIAIFWIPNRQPIVIVVYLTGGPATLQDREALIAQTGRIVLDALTTSDAH